MTGANNIMIPIFDRLKGLYFGLVVGDALGVPLEFTKRDSCPEVKGMVGGGVFGLKPGEWTDDTSMMLALSESLIANNEFIAIDIMDRFNNWYKLGKYSHNNKCFDIGYTTRVALETFTYTGNPYSGSTDTYSSGNGAIMRLAPILVKYYRDRELCILNSKKQSSLTHNSDKCIEYIEKMSRLLLDILEDKDIYELIDIEYYRNLDRKYVKSSGYVVDTYEAALWSISNTDNFKDALLLAVNLGDDSDTVGAVTGQIAGAIYGYNDIPEEWLDVIVWKDYINELFNKLL